MNGHTLYTVKRNPETRELEAVPDFASHKVIKHSDFAQGTMLKEGQKIKLIDKHKTSKGEQQCEACNGAGEVLQSDGSDSSGTYVLCESCNNHT